MGGVTSNKNSKMRTSSLLGGAISLAVAAEAACPMMTGELNGRDTPENPHVFDRRDTEEFLSQFYLNDSNSYLTSDVGGPISDQNSLKAGERGPTLLEDFIFRQKIQHFDHERVRVAHYLDIFRL
jgi:catalase